MISSLDTRQLRIALWLLDQSEPQSTEAVAQALGLSQRVIRYRLPAVEAYFEKCGLALTKQRGVGLSVVGSKDARSDAQADLRAAEDPNRVFAKGERSDVVRAMLLGRAPASMTIEELQGSLEVSGTSARRDAKDCEPWFEQMGLHINRKAGVGLSLVGPETAIRRAASKLVLEMLPGDALNELMTSPEAEMLDTRVSAGAREFLAALPLYECAQVIANHGPPGSATTLAIHLAVTAWRSSHGHALTMEPGQLRSATDHPVFATAQGLALSVNSATDVALSDSEVAGLTEFLLGLTQLQELPETEPNEIHLLDRVMEYAGTHLHPVLEDDAELRRSLGQHLSRLGVRIQYQLPVHNPLLADVAARYPDVHTTAMGIGELLEAEFGVDVSRDEIGFITMYLSGAMERTHLWPRRKAMVVCPSGVATAWILVSRIQAEFPQLEISEVVSAQEFSPDASVDVIISTIDLDHDVNPVVVVNPLLTTADVRAIGRLLTAP